MKRTLIKYQCLTALAWAVCLGSFNTIFEFLDKTLLELDVIEIILTPFSLAKLIMSKISLVSPEFHIIISMSPLSIIPKSP